VLRRKSANAMSPLPRRRIILLTALALLLAFVGEALPRALQLSARSQTGLLSARVLTGALLFFAGALLMGTIDPSRALSWSLVVGSGPLVHFLLRMLYQRPVSLWPIAVVLAAAFGWVPAILGALLGRRLRGRGPPGE
jgi:hypothetical protein